MFARPLVDHLRIMTALTVAGWALTIAGVRAASPPEKTTGTRYVSPAEARMRADVSFLADDLREGRGPGTNGLDDAAEYIATAFREAGLTTAPGAEEYYQPFTLPSEPILSGDVTFAVETSAGKALSAEPKTDFSALGYGGAADLQDVPLVFAGYGITAKDEERELDYDDYKGLDAKGKAVLIIRREPQQDDEDSPFAGTQTTTYATFRHKYRNAEEHGAKALLLVNDTGSLDGETDQLLDFPAAGFDGGDIPFVMISRAYADRLLAASGAPTLAELERLDRRGPEAGKPAARRAESRRRVHHRARSGSRSRTSSACWKGPGRWPRRRSSSAPITTTSASAGSGSLAFGSPRHPQRGRRQRLRHRDGAGTGPPPGPSATTRCPAASSSSPSRARSAGCSARSTTSTTRSIRLTRPSRWSTSTWSAGSTRTT